MNASPSRRRPWVAALLALLCNGLGHVYAGRILAGIAIHLLWLLAGAALMIALRLGFSAAIAAGGAMLVLWCVQAALAARAARAADEAGRSWLSRPLGLVTFYVLTFLPSVVVREVLGPHTVRTFAVPTVAMTPTVLPGDWFVAVRGSPIERGAVVVHDAPPSSPRRDPLLKRVVAVGGDTVEVRDGHLVLNGEPLERERVPGPCSYQKQVERGAWYDEPCVEFVEKLGGHAYHTHCTPGLACGDFAPQTIPPGHVFVLGDHRDHSADSRVYGPVPEKAIVGQASYVYFSIGPSGVRWDRIGQAVR